MSLGIAMAAALGAAQPGDSAAPAPAAVAAATAAQGVTSYPPDFFAASQPTTAFDMISRLPGFAFDQGDNVRGFAGSAGNVLIDGARPASKDDTLQDILRRISASQVARVDVIRGGAPGIDMQGKSVIANVVRKSDGGLRVTTAAALNYVPDDGRLKPSVRLEGSGRAGPVNWEAGLLAGWGIDDGAGDGPLVRRTPDGTVIARAFQDSQGDAFRGNLTGAVEAPLLGGKLRLNGFAQYNPFKYRADDHYTFPAASLEQDRFKDDVTSGEAGLRYNRPLGPKTNLELFLVQRLGKEDVTDHFTSPTFDADFALHKTTGESIGRGILKHRFSDNLSVELGGEGAFNWLNGHTSYAENDIPIALPAANVRVEERRGEGFGTLTWRMAPTVTVEAGLRYEFSRISSSGDTDLSNSFRFAKPRGQVTWSPDANNQFRVRIEREVGQLRFGDFVASSSQISTGGVRSGNPNLSPQQDMVYEVAYEHRFWKGGQIGATYRHRKLTDVIDRAPIFDDACRLDLPVGATGVFDAPCNIGDGVRNDFAVVLTLPTDRLGLPRGQLQAQSTWHHSEVTDPTTHERREISGLHPVDWEVHFTQGLPRWKTTWGFDAFGRWRASYYRFNEIDTDELYTYVTVFAEYKPRPDLSIRGEFGNFTARPFKHSRAIYPGPRNTSQASFIESRDSRFGRMFYVRVRKTFG